MKKRILLVEDEILISNAYAMILREYKYVVETAGDGMQALTKIKSSKFDLVLLDIMLPKMSALDILQTLKKEGKLPKIPIILLTNLAQDPVIKELMGLGATSYLLKIDTDPGMLAEKVKEILN